MRTWLDKETRRWVTTRPKFAWTGLVDINTGEKIFEGDTISILFYDYRTSQDIRKNIKLTKDKNEWSPVLEPDLFQVKHKPILVKEI